MGVIAPLVRLARAVARRLGVDIVRYSPASGASSPLPDMSEEQLRIFAQVQPYTMSSPEGVVAMCDAVQYVVNNNIGGAIVECGVWRDGSIMAAALTLLRLHVTDREPYLFDTFMGMPEPGPEDQSHTGNSALEEWRKIEPEEPIGNWCRADLEQVRANVLAIGYPMAKIRFVKGPVEETLAAAAPERIALLRLDTDWYESTLHELELLYPRLPHGGILIVDDYGHWAGARKAVDEYIARNGLALFLGRIDYTGRIAVKQR